MRPWPLPDSFLAAGPTAEEIKLALLAEALAEPPERFRGETLDYLVSRPLARVRAGENLIGPAAESGKIAAEVYEAATGTVREAKIPDLSAAVRGRLDGISGRTWLFYEDNIRRYTDRPPSTPVGGIPEILERLFLDSLGLSELSVREEGEAIIWELAGEEPAAFRFAPDRLCFRAGDSHLTPSAAAERILASFNRIEADASELRRLTQEAARHV